MIEHFDRKFDEISGTLSRKTNRFFTAAIVIMVSAFAIIVVNARMIGGLKSKVDIIHDSYVPGSLLWDFSNAIDQQFESLYQLENGNPDTALYIVEKFATHRKELYDVHMKKTRGNKKSQASLKPLE